MSRQAARPALVCAAFAVFTFTASVLQAADPKTSDWKPLFDGRSTAGWRGYKTQEVPAGWKTS